MFELQGLIRATTDELAASITREQGKTLADARGDVFRGLEVTFGQMHSGRVDYFLFLARFLFPAQHTKGAPPLLHSPRPAPLPAIMPPPRTPLPAIAQTFARACLNWHIFRLRLSKRLWSRRAALRMGTGSKGSRS